MTETLRTIDMPATTLPVVQEADVVVVGGGTAGFVAAIAAARTGARTVLVERWGYLAGYKDAFVIGESHLGVRESRRIVGEYRLTLDDLLSNARFADVVALNCRALDRHLKGDVFKYDLLQGNHDIPLRALIPQKVLNLLVAGRCISSDHDANASLRGAATCMATGHAAGTAAALAAQGDGAVRTLDVKALQRTLRDQDVILSTGGHFTFDRQRPMTGNRKRVSNYDDLVRSRRWIALYRSTRMAYCPSM